MSTQNAILLTGGAGYIGSHIYFELIECDKFNDMEVVIVDNLSNSDLKNLFAVSREKKVGLRLKFYQIDLADDSALSTLEKRVFSKHHIVAVIHLAGLKSVKESIEDPTLYYRNNLNATTNLLTALQKWCKNDRIRFIFSSSATIYGSGCELPITENSRGEGPINAYGRTKLWIEEMLRDTISKNSIWEIIVLRYFNPIGVHPSGLLKESPVGIPENLVPYVLDVVRGRFPQLKVFGNDYNTIDGTPVRDYIHVVDLARAHIKALEYQFNSEGESRYQIYNIGTGVGYSVLQVIDEFNKLGHNIPYKVVGRRQGDSPATYADPSKAFERLGWRAEFGLEEMVRDACKQLE